MDVDDDKGEEASEDDRNDGEQDSMLSHGISVGMYVILLAESYYSSSAAAAPASSRVSPLLCLSVSSPEVFRPAVEKVKSD